MFGVESSGDTNGDDRKRDDLAERHSMLVARGLHVHWPNQKSHASVPTTNPADTHTKSRNGRMPSIPIAMNATRATMAPIIPTKALNIHAGKYAPNNS